MIRIPPAMTHSDVSAMEAALGVKLPAAYVSFLKKPLEETAENVDESSVMRDADGIIGATREYREGFAGLNAWPQEWVYLGDEDDACPYALDCASGRVLRTDKGNPDRPPITEFGSFKAFVDHFAEQAGPSRPQSKWIGFIVDHLAIIAMLIIFVILPLLAYSVSLLWKWAFGN